MDKKFKIDFFEFSFLVEACIPPRPIARSMFWDEVINEYYHQMTSEERSRLFEWITNNGNFDLKEQRCQEFHARFDPNNQYKVFTDNGEEHKCFLLNGKYYISKNSYIGKEHIKDIKKINE